jgi:UV DNA damage endonuclease
MIRFGLCCIFTSQPIRFRRKTAASLRGLPRARQLELLAEICLANARSLRAALEYCHERGIGDFRINSQILPLATHPEAGYRLEDLPGSGEIIAAFRSCGEFRRRHGLRTTFHPDQFVLLNSPSQEVTRHSLAELVYQADLAGLVGSDVINIHGGGGYGEKPAALKRLAARIGGLPPAVYRRLSLENDDRIYGPRELLRVCEETGVPLAYDVHHHRCLPDGLSVEEVSERAAATWHRCGREPCFHLSSPRQGWEGEKPRRHHDYIDVRDFPACWLERRDRITVEIEAKHKELAVLRLMGELSAGGSDSGSPAVLPTPGGKT